MVRHNGSRVLCIQKIITILIGTAILLTPIQIQASEVKYNYHLTEISNGIIYKPEIQTPQSVRLSIESSNNVSQRNNDHSIRATKTISEDSLRRFLEQKGSPLAPFTRQLLNSLYYSTIIAITNAEESFSINPAQSNNLYGLMANGRIIHFSDIPTGLEAINNFLTKAENNGHDTIEKLNCWYVQPCSSNWYNTVLKVKAEVESL
jgi:hypothetical protein